MIGQSERSWSWLHSVVVPAALALVEASWLWAFLAATAHVAPRRRADVPFLAVLLPALLGLLVSATLARRRMRPWRRDVLAVLAVLAGAALTAGALGALYLHGSFVRFAFEPFAVPGGAAGAGAALAWFVASISWARGTWLGWREPSHSAAVRSVLLAGAAFVVFFLVAAARRHEPGFAAELVPAAVLFVVSCPAATAALALVNERELERWRLRGQGARPSLSWFFAVFVPMALVAGAGLLAAAAVGPLGRLTVRGLRDVAVWIGHLLLALARLIGRLFHGRLAEARRLQPAHRLVPVLPRTHPAHLPAWLAALAEALGALVALVVLVLVARLAIGLARRLRRRRARGPGSPAAEELRESLFSWRHLLDQLLGVFRRRLASMRLRRLETAPPSPGTGQRAADEATVREHYRRFLLAARRAGSGRAPSETPLELEQRLLAGLQLGAELGPLAPLTALYDDARYGGLGGSDEAAVAAGHSEALVAALESARERAQAPAGEAGGPGA